MLEPSFKPNSYLILILLSFYHTSLGLSLGLQSLASQAIRSRDLTYRIPDLRSAGPTTSGTPNTHTRSDSRQETACIHVYMYTHNPIL